MQKYKKILYKDTEQRLYMYFNRDTLIKGLQMQLDVIEKQLKNIDEELRERTYIHIEEESKSPGFDERVQTSGTGISYAESQVLRITEIKLRRRAKKELEKEKILEKIENIETVESEMKWKVGQLKEEYQKMLQLIYKDKKNEIQISMELHLSQSQVNKRKNQILEQIFMWEKWG